MRTSSYLLILSLALLVAAFFGALAYYTYSPPPLQPAKDSPSAEGLQPPPARPVISANDPIRGNPSAPITIVEFGDFLCPACAEISSTLKQFLDEQNGKVKLVWKDFPNIRRHPLSERAAQSARCAQEQDQFWQYHDRLLANTNQGQSLSEQKLSLIAENLNLNLNAFNECLSSSRTGAIVERNLNEALLLGADATPYLFIGNKRLSGAVTEAELKNALQSAL